MNNNKGARKLARELPDIEYLRECFRYDEDAGILWWSAERPRNHFASDQSYKCYMSRNAGKPVGFVGSTKPVWSQHKPHCLLRMSLNLRDGKYSMSMYVHRIIYAVYHGFWPRSAVVHLDGDMVNNKISNLVETDRYDNKSGTSGVTKDSATGKWNVHFSVNGKYRYFGRYGSLEEALAVEKRCRSEACSEISAGA